MSPDYLPLAQWGSVISFGVLFGITSTFSGVFFYNKIMEKKEAINKKVRQELKNRVDRFNQIIEQYGDQEFVDQVRRIVEFKVILDKSRVRFEWYIIGSAVGIVLLNILYILLVDNRDSILTIGVIMLGVHIINWLFLVRDNNRVEQFLEGKDPKAILGE